MSIKKINTELNRLKDKRRAAILQRFFKTGPGEYGQGDVFYGIPVPALRRLVKQFPQMKIGDIQALISSPVHEVRLLAVLFLVDQYQRGDERLKQKVYIRYLNNSRFVNNWDLVDASAPHIVGAYLEKKSKKVLYELARSEVLWDRRIAMMATFRYIRKHSFSETLKIAEILIHDHEDLIQKAVGWMLREIGKRELEKEESFLKCYYRMMPRTMLRYVIEAFPESKRQAYLKGKI